MASVPFSDVLGHETIRRHLMGACLSDQVSHAYLFEGIEGVGRHTTAYAMIRTLVCTENKDAEGHILREGCGCCVACRTAMDGNHPDVRLISPSPDKNTITVKTVREELIRDMAVRPYQGRHKLFLVEHAEQMNTEAQNALLKTLEEPPEYGHIILLAGSAQAMLSTIESRCVKVSFQPLPAELIRGALKERGMNSEQVALGTTFAGGSLGQALRVCTDLDFTDMRRQVYELLSQAPFKGTGWLLSQEELLEVFKKDFHRLLELWEAWFRDLLVVRETGRDELVLSADYLPAIREAAVCYSPAKLSGIIWQIADIRAKLEQNVNYSLSMDCLLLSVGTSDGTK